jgi:hypothetical protein
MTERSFTGAEILRRHRQQGAFFEEKELNELEQVKAQDRPPRNKWSEHAVEDDRV